MDVSPWYIAVRPFGPADGERWTRFVEWSGLSHLGELVSIDDLLCKHVVDVSTFTAEDWRHNVQEDFVLDFFVDLDHLMQRVAQMGRVNILAAKRAPDEECAHAFRDARFRFRGYDLVEPGCGPSALTDCGGFPLAFKNDELNWFGLLDNFARAVEVQAALERIYPDVHRGLWDVWAIWRMETGP